MSSLRLNITLTARLAERLNADAEKEGNSVASVIRRILTKHYVDIDRNGNRELLSEVEEAIPQKG